MSLRDSIKDLRNIAKRLDNATFNPQMNALEKFLGGITVDKTPEPPKDILKLLLTKFLRGERNFLSRELKALPFIIYESQINYNHTIEILRRLDFSKTSHLRRVLNVYLLNYDDSNKTELLRRTLSRINSVDSISLKKTFVNGDKLFADNRLDNMANLFADKLSVKTSLEIIGLSDFYKVSKFIQTAIKIFFRSNIAVKVQFKILDELDSDFDSYANIFPDIADALIKTVFRTGFGKDKCIEIFYRRLGDPRFGKDRFKWDNVSQKSKDIFSQWLSAEDLETFFKIIKQTALDRMWRYREKFWRAYLKYIVKTKIFLGNDAKQLAKQLGDKNIKHGDLYGASSNQSVFVFQIGRYIFSEWSHNGKLRVHKIDSTINLFDTTENFFENNSISRDIIIQNFIKEWTHYPNDGANSWQNKVSQWLAKNCGINKTQRDWGR